MKYSIGDVAQRLGIAEHVLRHWDDVGVLVPARVASGHRRYTENDIAQAVLVRRLQRAGLSLPDIRTVLSGSRAEREGIVEPQLKRLRSEVAERKAGIGFLEHTRQCQHRLIATCPECSDYADAATQRLRHP